MEHIQEILNIPLTQLVGVLLAVGMAERMGIPVVSFIKSFLKLENQRQAHHEQISILQNHAKVANHEMGDVKVSIEKIEKRMDTFDLRVEKIGDDVSFIKGKLS